MRSLMFKVVLRLQPAHINKNNLSLIYFVDAFDLVLYIIKTQILYKLRVRSPFIINTDIVKSLYFATLDAILL